MTVADERAPSPGLTDLDALMSTLAVRNLAESLLACIPSGASVLVAGTGLSVVVDTLAAHDRNILAIDPSAAVLETLTPASNIGGQVAAPDRLNADDQSVDAVVLVDVVVGLDRSSAEALLADVERVVTPAGIVILTVPSEEPNAELVRHQLEARWNNVSVSRQVDLGGYAVVGAGTGRDSISLVAGRPLSGAVRWVYTAAHRAVEPPFSMAHVAPGVPNGLTTGMHELLTEQLVLRQHLSQVEADLDRLRDVQRHLVEAEQAAGRSRELEAALVDSQERIEELHGMIDTILRSTSWKVTEPVRRAGGMARNMSNKLALDTVRDTVRKYRQG